MNTKRINIWLDCDPGHDDMMAIILSSLNPNINLIGISTSAGNSSIQNTTQNALNILHQINTNIPVIKGSSKPLLGSMSFAPDIHGQDGLAGAVLKQSSQKPIQKDPYLQIYKRISNCSQKVSVVCTGAMTNLAILLVAFPQITQKIEEISVMGGAIGLGNITPSAQFNIYIDPLAAQIVLNSGIKFSMVPLQVTHTVLATQEIFEEFKGLKTQFGQKLYNLFRFFQKTYLQMQNFQFPPVHDPCAVFYLLQRNQFTGRNAQVSIDLFPGSYGRTNCNFNSKKPNAFVCEKINVKRFWQVMISALKSIKYVE